MGLNYKLVIYLLAVLICVDSQGYYPYTQYQYQPYAQYSSAYNPGYVPYPYVSQPYQPYVSPPPSTYIPYYNPAPSYPIPATYPTQSYQSPYNSGYYPQSFYPYNTVGSGYVPATPYVNPTYSAVANSTLADPDPYANITTEFIDIEPRYFHYYKKFFNLEDNLSPIQVIDSDQQSASSQPPYVVKTESKQSNFTSFPQSISKHDVQSKTYSFKRTFTIDPSKKENAVINLNFVNGVQITTEAPEEEMNDATAPPATENTLITTTENDQPEHIVSWFR